MNPRIDNVMKSVSNINLTNRGGSLVAALRYSAAHTRAGLFTSSPATAQTDTLRAFRFYPCRKIAALIFILSSVFTHAQVLTLDSVLRRIEENNPMLQEYDQKIKALNAYAGGAKSWMAPMVGAGTFMTPYPNQKIDHERDKGSWMFSIEQQIPNPAKLSANQNYLKSKQEIEKQNRAIQFNELRAQAKSIYYQWIVAEKKLGILDESARAIALTTELARIRYSSNQGTLGNVYLAESKSAEIQNMIMMTNGEIEDYAARMKALINVAINDSIMVDTTTTITFNARQIVDDTAAIAQRKSNIRQIDESIEAMRLNQQFQKMQARPDFKLRFDHMQPIGNMPTQFTAMAMMSIPIAPWSSRMYKAEARGMQYDIAGMQRQRQAMILESRGMISGMAKQLTRMKQQLDNYRMKILPALGKNYEVTRSAYGENTTQLPNVIDAWDALNMAQLEYLQKVESYYLMIVNYEKELEK